MSGSGVFDVSRLCDTVVMPARRIVGWMSALDSKSAWRAERANRAITGVCGLQWLGAARSSIFGVAGVRC